MATLLYRLGAFAARRRWAFLISWVVILAVVGGGALAFKGVMTNSFTIPGTQAQQALDQLKREIPATGGATGRVVFAVPEGNGSPTMHRRWPRSSRRSARCLASSAPSTR